MRRTRALLTTAAVAATIAIVAGVLGVANASSSKVSVAAAPKGFQAFLVYLAEPTLAPGEDSSFTDAEHVDFFQHTIMGRTPEEVGEQEQLAKDYFHDRFGLDSGSSDILIHYQSHSPIIGRADGEVSFNCDLTSIAWGPGAARGVALPDGSIRNVITFPSNL